MTKNDVKKANTDYFIRGYRAAKKLESYWKMCEQCACIPHPLGIDFFNTKTTTPIEAINYLKEQYDVSFETVENWVDNLKIEDSYIVLN